MKGISPLFASVLLVAMTITIGALISSFYRGSFSVISDEAESQRLETVECNYKEIEISDVSIDTSVSDQKIIITITNTGKGNITLVDANIYDKTGEKCTFDANGQVLETGESKVYQNTTGCAIFSPQCSDFSHVFVTTSCGNVYDTFRTKPDC